MKQSTLCFCLRSDQVLLAMKKRGFGVGKWNGYGGKVGQGEEPNDAAIRELKEESELTSRVGCLVQVAIIRFFFEDEPVFECYVFLTKEWEGEPRETEEMAPRWFPLDGLPFEEMWPADRLWIPLVLAGEKIRAEVRFNKEGTEVLEFTYNPLK